jgi:hypothetical protein
METSLQGSTELPAREINVVLSSSSLHPAFPTRGLAPLAVNHTEADRFLSHPNLVCNS